MDKQLSITAKALYLALLTRQITPWQAVWRQPPAQGRAWQELSANLYSKILEPMWWCCRGPQPVTPLQKGSLFWLSRLTLEPTPVAGRLWLSAVKSRYQALTGADLLLDTDTFLLCCFWDFSSADELYKTGAYVNEMD